ncbi:MAG: hypothetical protein ACOYXN_02210 [Acidobacteriota bacterium]
MADTWIFVAVAGRGTLAIPFPEVVRILHRGDSDWGPHRPSALHLARVLGWGSDEPDPGVLLLLADGRAWLADDVTRPASTDWEYLPIPEACLRTRPGWARAVLHSGEGHAFVVDVGALEALS